MAEQYEFAADEASKATSGTTGWLTKQYKDALEAGETSATSAKDWVVEDVGKIGTWQYKVVTLTLRTEKSVEEELNRLGTQRWECFFVQPRNSSHVICYLKRPHRSYLKQLPAKDLLKLLPLLPGGDTDVAE